MSENILDKLDTVISAKPGTYLEMGAPDEPTMVPGSPDLLSRLSEVAAGRQPTPYRQPEGGGINQRAGSLATGFNDAAIANTLGWLPDTAAWALNKPIGLINELYRGAPAGLPRPGDLARGGAIEGAPEQPLIPPITNPVGGSEWFRNRIGETVGRTEPKDNLDQLLYGAGAGVGSATGMAGAAHTLLSRAPGVARALGGDLTVPAQAANLGFGGLSGVGGEIGQYGAGEDPITRQLAAIAGSMAAPIGVAGGIRGAQALRSRVGPALFRSEAENAAARRIQDSVENRLDALRNYNPNPLVPGSNPSLAQATGDVGLQRLEAEVTAGLRPGEGTPAQQAVATRAADQGTARVGELGDIAQDTGGVPLAYQDELLRQQQAAQSKVNADLLAQQQREAQQATTHQANLAAQQQQIADLATRHQAELDAIQQRATETQTGLGTRAKPEERGAAIAGEIQAAKTTSKEAAQAISNMVDPAESISRDPGYTGTLQKPLVINNVTAASKANEILAEEKRTGRKPISDPEEKRIFDTVRMWGTKVPFYQTNAMRGDILTAIRIERATNGETPMVARLTNLRQTIDDMIDTQLPTDARDRWRAAQDAWRVHAETFKNPAVAPILDTAQAGGPKMFRTDVPGAVLRNNETAQAFLTAGGDTQTLRGALLDDLHGSLGGQPLTEARLQTWLKKRGDALRAVPGLNAEVSTAAQAQTALDALPKVQARETTAATREAATLEATQAAEARSLAGERKTLEAQHYDEQRQREAGSLGRIVNAAPADVPGLIGGALERTDAATQMMRLRQQVAGNAEAEKGLARAAIDHIVDKFVHPVTGQPKTPGFLAFVNSKEGALQAAGVTPDGINRLRAIAEDMLRPPPGTATTVGANRSGEPSSYSNVFRNIMSSLNTKSHGALSGVGSGLAGGAIAGALTGADVMSMGALGLAGLAISPVVRLLGGHGITNVNQLLAEAIDNPAIGRAMMMRATPQNLPVVETALRMALQGEAATYGAGYDRDKLRLKLLKERQQQRR